MVSAHPRQENLAKVNLQRQRCVTWLPRLLESRRRAELADEVAYPLFPGYLFVQLEGCAPSWRPAGSALGVRHLVALGGNQTLICVGVVEELHPLADDNSVVSPAPHEIEVGQSLRTLTAHVLSASEPCCACSPVSA